MNLSLLVGAPVLVAGMVLVSFSLALRTKRRYAASLTCPKCGGVFEHSWVPWSSFRALRLGEERELKCPRCRRRSGFRVFDAVVREPGAPESPAPAQPTGA